MENADLQSRKMMGSNPSTRANMVASTRGLSHRPLFGLVINMSAILISDTTRRSRGFESPYKPPIKDAYSQRLFIIYCRFDSYLFNHLEKSPNGMAIVSCFMG